MNEHILDLLEFPKVRALVAERTGSARGRRLALSIHPDTDRGRIAAALERTRQAVGLIVAGRDPGPLEVEDLGAMLSRLRPEGDFLQPEEILSLRGLMIASTRVRRTLDQPEVRDRFPELYALGLRFGDFDAIVRRLEEVFDPAGDFLDTASPNLERIRRRLRNARAEAGEALSSLARRESRHPEDTFVTLRDGRYVLAVRSEDRSRLPGIVHGHSGSGQTVFLEPMQAIERNNAIAEHEAEEKEEKIAILRDLSARLRDKAEALRESDDAVAELDLLRAGARLGLDLDGRIPSLNDGERIRIVAGRHPLLAAAERAGGPRVVPLMIELSDPRRTLVLSGPNMGGKTVALKTVGLLTLMAQSGLPVPAADGTELPVLDGVFADLGDEQSIERETSTFSGHLRNIALAWENARPASLVLLDEVGGGTDPDEGSALGRALLELMTERRAFVLATTHLAGLKLLAHEDDRMLNAAMEFDPETQQPTYRLRIGEPGRSRAFELARKMLPGSELLDRAEGYRSRWSAELDDLLSHLEQERIRLGEEIARADLDRRSLQEARDRRDREAERLRERLRRIREARWEKTGEALREAEALLLEVRRIHAEAVKSRRSGGAAGATRIEGGADLAEALGRLGEAASRLRRPREPRGGFLEKGDALPGREVYSVDLKSIVRIESEPDAAERVWIVHGTFRLQVPLSSLVHPPAGSPAAPIRRRKRVGPSQEDLPPLEREIDVRGQSAEEGLAMVERFIDRASIAGGAELRIIHGKGKGILKREIEEFLKRSPLVESYRIGEPREGGWGATIVLVRSAQVGG